MSTPASQAEVVVRDNPEEHRYEAYVGSDLAGFADYHEQPGLVTVLHTEVEPAFEGQGVGSAFVRGMLGDIRSRGSRVLAVCPFVGAYLKRHPEWGDLVWKP
jgi:predicted GNAT family acetyltransferase